VAVVNDQVITLTELRIARAFGLYSDSKSHQVGSPSFYLDKLIEQRLINQVAGQEVKVENKEVEVYLQKIRNKMGAKLVEKKLKEFGLDEDGLRMYIQLQILCDKIVSQKLFQNVAVTLEEIENYYQQVYLSSQREKGLQPQPMIEIVDEIEAVIREEKRKRQVEEWIANLKRQADIQIKVKNLDEYFRRQERKS